MSFSAPLSIVFASEAAANHLVAGIPAASRAIFNASLAEQAIDSSCEIFIAVPGGWRPSDLCRQEALRLAPSQRWSAAGTDCQTGTRWVGGASLQSNHDEPLVEDDLEDILLRTSDIPTLQRQSRHIVAATGKPGDGIVSRYINRPISRAMSRLVLLWPGIRPWHATLAAAVIGLAMVAALLLGGHPGLLIGATTFQLASIVDGVDGEIARATYRTSASGALFDSITDAVTNLGFVAGVSYNLYATGDERAGLAGVFGFTLLALGTGLVAVRSNLDGHHFSFDALKSRFSARSSRVRQWLAYLTMRDFCAFAGFLAILAGFASYALMSFAVVAAAWFLTVCWTLFSPKQ